MATVAYADPSALAKLIEEEAESDAVRHFLGDSSEVVSSEIVEVELGRLALRRQRSAAAVLSGVTLVRLTPAIREQAATVGPPRLRALDAIHLASALSLCVDEIVFVAYDQRLLAAARAVGLEAVAPS